MKAWLASRSSRRVLERTRYWSARRRAGDHDEAIRSTRPGGYVSYVGVPHDMELNGEELFFAHVHLHGGPAPVRRFLPKLIDLVWTEKIHPGKVFDLTLPLDQVAEGYCAMDERRAIKAILQP